MAEPERGDSQTVSRVLVPKDAVVRRDGATFVFVIKDQRVEQRTVRLGDEVAGMHQVFDGLSGGESVATIGAETLGDGDRVKVQ